MHFYKKLYVSGKIKNPRKIRRDLQNGKGSLLLYLLVLTRKPDGTPQLEIMHCAGLKQEYYRTHPPLIIGMAEGKADAIGLVNEITQESFDKSGQWNAAVYLLKKTGMR